MEADELESIGLTKTETRIYLALLRIGQSTTTAIVRESGIHASKVYEFLDRLSQKGLVSRAVKSNKRYFTAAEPEALKEYLAEKRRSIEEQEARMGMLIPRLRKLKADGKSVISVETYQGLAGIKSFYEKLLTRLKRGQTQHVLGSPRIGNERIEAYLLEWHSRRIKKGIRCRFIYDSNVRDYGRLREKMKSTEVRYLPKKISSPVWIEIDGDFVAMCHIEGYDAVMCVIEDKEMAKGYLDYFNIIWDVSER